MCGVLYFLFIFVFLLTFFIPLVLKYEEHPF
jgi:hypothetical protein